jgi:hypothetical protein
MQKSLPNALVYDLTANDIRKRQLSPIKKLCGDATPQSLIELES